MIAFVLLVVGFTSILVGGAYILAGDQSEGEERK